MYRIDQGNKATNLYNLYCNLQGLTVFGVKDKQPDICSLQTKKNLELKYNDNLYAFTRGKN